MSRFFLIFVAALAVSACSNKVEDLKSPCVGAENSPCDRRPVNQDLG